ncbi:O-antigen ligase family protein [Sphingomonas sanguinis]|uniref:O-antigen ligase family protein n=1 Tax=Sphingomonas sanguinis TaxID=33051 RepID=UPI001C575B1B|nr:O-antigen ligase family protein [Sphingomonas sanguinis]QXT35524.1 O-antigen ligase family protein [Sphingomonas sanguinis]
MTSNSVPPSDAMPQPMPIDDGFEMRTLRRRSVKPAFLSPTGIGTMVAAAMIIMTVLGPLMTYKPEPFTGEGSPLRQICYFAILPVAIFAVRPLHRPERLLAVPWTLLVALGWCWLSLSWSIAPDIGIRRLLLTTIVIWTLFLTVESIGYERVMKVTRIVMVVTLAVNFLTVLAVPSFGIHQAAAAADASDPGLVGDWRGMMLQKNFAGAACAFTLIMFMLDAGRIARWIRALVVVAAVVFLIKSGSKTSMGIAVLGIGIGFLYTRYNPAYRSLLIPALLIVSVTITLLLQIYWDDLIAPLSDQGAFTGRTQIWPPLFAYFQDHWFFGTGYGSFWNIGFGKSPIFTYSKGWVLHITQGHNGYLDLLVTIGLPGLLLVIFATIVVPIGRLLSSKTAPRGPGSVVLAMLIFAMGHNFTESSIFDRDAIVQTFLMLAVALGYNITRADTGRRRRLTVDRDATNGGVTA